MNLETNTTTNQSKTSGSKKNLKDYRASELVKDFYKFVANHNLRETAHRGLQAAIEERNRILESNAKIKDKTIN